MKWRALASDFDGTLASEGIVDANTEDAIGRLARADVPMILVTGREMKDFDNLQVNLQLFSLIVAENGAVLYNPRTGTEELLGHSPSPDFVAELTRRGVGPISVGKSIVATWEPHENAVLQTIKELGLELQVIFNKGAVMILPPGVNKATGLHVALDRLGLSAGEVVGVGDAENDHAFLEICGFSVAVANALPSLKDKADYVTQRERGEGVADLINRLMLGQFDSFQRVAHSAVAA